MSKLQYQSGFANEFATEAVAGALPKGQNAPQKSSLGTLHGTIQRYPLHCSTSHQSPLPGSIASVPRSPIDPLWNSRANRHAQRAL